MIGKSLSKLIIQGSDAIAGAKTKYLSGGQVDYGSSEPAATEPSTDELMWMPLELLADKFGMKDDDE